MYPTVIIILVTLKKSHLEDQFTYPGSSAAGSLPFAARVPPSSTWAATDDDVRQRVTLAGMTFGQNSSRSISDGDGTEDATAASALEKESLKAEV